MSKTEKKKFALFSDCYKNVEQYKHFTELNMTHAEGFELKEVSDIEMFRTSLTSLLNLNISGNLISRLILRNISNLTRIKASMNMISEVTLSLNKLKELDLSGNMLSNMFDLSSLPMLHTLNVSKNLIKKVEVRDLNPVKMSLRVFDLSYNKINFKANEFVVFVEGMKILNLENFSIVGNEFINKNEIIKKNYKILIISFLKSLIKLDDKVIDLNKEKINSNEVTRLILSSRDENTPTANPTAENDESQNNKISHKVYRHAMDNKTPDLVSQLKLLNKICEELNYTNMTNQSLYLKFLYEINQCMAEINLKKQPLHENQSLKKFNEEIQEEFSALLMNMFFMIEINPNFDKTIYEIIAGFALYNKGETFAEKCFDFFYSLVESSTHRKPDILDVLQKVIICQIKGLQGDPPFKILKFLLEFYKQTEVSCGELYSSLISNNLNYLKNKDLVELTSDEEKEKVITSLNFIRNYLKLDINEAGEIEESEEGNGVYEKEETITHIIDPEHRDEGLDESDISGLVSDESSESNSFNSKDYYQDEYNFDICKIEDRFEAILPDAFEEEEEDEPNHLEDNLLPNYNKRNSNEKDDSKSALSKLNKRNIILPSSSATGLKFKNNKSIQTLLGFTRTEKLQLENLFKEGKLSMKTDEFEKIHKEIQKFTNQDFGSLESYEKKFVTLFIHVFSKCVNMIVYLLPTLFKDSNESNSTSKDKMGYKCNYSEILFDTLLNVLITLSNRFEFHSEKINPDYKRFIEEKISVSNLLNAFKSFLEKLLDSYCEDQKNFISYIELNVFDINKRSEEDRKENENYKDDSQNDNIERLAKFKARLARIMNCYGGIIRMCNSLVVKSEIDGPIAECVFKILNFKTNDPFILIGACKFTLNVMSSEYLKQENIRFEKVLNKVQNFVVLLKYITETDSSYKTSLEKIRTTYEHGDHTDDTFTNLRSYLMIKLIISIIKLLRLIAYATLLKSPLSAELANKSLTDNNLHSLLGESLRIDDDLVRKVAVDCLYYYDYTNIKDEVLKQIIRIISKFHSVTKGETEIILSTIYIILTNIIIDPKAKVDILREAIEMAIIFTKKNLDRNPTQKDEIEQKNTLSACLILFLNTASRFPEFNSILKCGVEADFKNIIYLDSINYQSDNYLPIEIERTILGNYLTVLFEVSRNENVIPPFSFPFVRIMIKIADLVSNAEEFTYKVDYSQDTNNLVTNLTMLIKRRVKFRFVNEKLSWYDFSLNLLEWIQDDRSIDTLSEEKVIRDYLTKATDDSNLIINEDKFLVDYLDEASQMKEKLNPIKTDDNTNEIQNGVSNEFNLKFNAAINNKFNNILRQSNVKGSIQDEPKTTFKQNSVMFNFNGENSNRDSTVKSYIQNKRNSSLGHTNLFSKGTENKQSNQISASNHLNKQQTPLQPKIKEMSSKSTKIYSSDYLPKLGVQELIEEHLNFSIYFNNLIMYIFGQTSSFYDPEVEKSLLSKSDSSRRSESDVIINLLREYNSSNIKQIKEADPVDKFILEKMKVEAKENLSELSLRGVMAASDKNILHDIYDENLRKFYYNLFPNDLEKSTEYLHKDKRLIQEESLHNPQIRSLITSTLLRCIYSVLISPSIQIRQNFLEILFKIEKWKNLLTLLETSQLFEYHIAHKSLNVFENIFNKNNLLFIYKSYSEDKITVNEEKLFHSFHMFTIYFEKVLFHYDKLFFKLEKYDYIFIRDFTLTIYNFISAFSSFKFNIADDVFIQHHIYKKIIKEESIDIILYCLRAMEFLHKKAVHRIFQEKKNFYENKSNESIKAKVERNEKYLQTYILFIENTIEKIYKTLALISKIYPASNNYIVKKITCSHLEIERVISKIIYKNMKKEVKLNDDDPIIKRKNVIELKKNEMMNLFNSSVRQVNRISKFKEQVLKFSWKEQVLIYEICYCLCLYQKEKGEDVNSNFNSHKNIPSKFILTNDKLYIYEDKQNSTNQNLNNESIENVNNYQHHNLILKIAKITKIFLYDYYNRIIIKSENVMFSLLLPSFLVSKLLVEHLKFHNSEIEVVYVNSIVNQIKKIEDNDPYVKTRIKDKVNLMNKKESSDEGNKNIKIEVQRLDELYSNLFKEFTMQNNIYNNFYTIDNLNLIDINVFIAVKDFENEENVSINYKDKYVIHISEYYFYYLKESFNEFKEPSEKLVINGKLIIEDKKFNTNAISKIQIQNLKKMERLNHFTIKLSFSDDINSINGTNISFSFFSEFEVFLFSYKLDSVVRKNIMEKLNKNSNK